jgi:putative serine protease PepD
MARKSIAGAVAAAALVGGGVGAGVVAISNGSGSQSAASTTTVAAAPSTTNISNGSLTIADIAKQDSPSVVEIDATESAGSSTFGGGSSATQAEGTGFVYDDKGDIVTNDHVVNGASSISVKLNNGQTYKATVVGADITTDIAVIHIDASGLTPLTLADSSNVQVGDAVVAIGNPFGLDDTVTSGIVSALNRQITAPDNTTPIAGAIQTDAAINHGNSGGPLLNMNGEVIGITSQIQSDGGGNEGVGFAIPSNLVRTIVNELISSGSAQHAQLGVVPSTTSTNGVKVTSVEAGSGAKKAGLQVGDVITELDGTAITSADQLRAIIAVRKPGETVTLTIRRNGDTKTVKATLGNRPANS